MTIEFSRDEAKILIAVLAFAESAAALLDTPGMVSAITELRTWRTALLLAYLRSAAVEEQTRVGGTEKPSQ